MPPRFPASKSLICASVPVRVTLPVAEPTTTTPVLPAFTVRVPDTTVKLACTVEPPASTSEMLSPVPCNTKLSCSVAE